MPSSNTGESAGGEGGVGGQESLQILLVLHVLNSGLHLLGSKTVPGLPLFLQASSLGFLNVLNELFILFLLLQP